MNARQAAAVVGGAVALSLASATTLTDWPPGALAAGGLALALLLAALVGGGVDKKVRRLSAEVRERDVMEDALGKFVHSQYVSTLMVDPTALQPGGVQRTVTVLMSDLRGFTGLAERYAPGDFVELLNAYLGRMADVVNRHGGSVNEFIGDAVLALFGAREGDLHDPVRAAACAADMQQELARFNDEHPEHVDLQMGVGLATGEVVVGNIGSERRLKFGVVGEAVNLASRVESFTVGGEVLLAHETFELVRGSVEAEGPQEVAVKGRSAPLTMWSLQGVGPPYDLVVPKAAAAGGVFDVDLRTYVFTVTGKHVAQVALEASMTGLSADKADLIFETDNARLFDNIKLRIEVPGGEPLEDLYGKLVAAEALDDGRRRWRVRFTSVPAPSRLGALLPLTPASPPASPPAG